MSAGTDQVDNDCSHSPTNMVVHHKVSCYKITTNSPQTATVKCNEIMFLLGTA